MRNYLNCRKFGKNQAVKTNQYKLDSCVVLVTVLFSLIFAVGVTFSLSLQTASGVSRKLIVQAQTKEQRREEAINLNNQGLQLLGQDKYREALGLLEKALVIFREIDEKALLNVILYNIGEVYGNLGEYQKALDYYQQSLVISQKIGDKAGESETLNNIGAVYYSLGEYQKALDYYQQSLAIKQKIGNKSGDGNTLNNIGAVYHSLGQYQKALDYYQQSLAIRQQIGNKAGESETLNNIGTVYDSLGQYQIALDYYQKALSLVQKIGDKADEGIYLNNIGLLYFNLKQYQKALDYYHKALFLVQKIGNKAVEGITLNNIGAVYDNLGQYQKALDYYHKSLLFRQQIGDKAGEGETLNNIGQVYYNLEQYQKALDYFQQVLVILKQVDYKALEGNTLNNIGAIYIAQSQYLQAEKKLLAAIQIWEMLRKKLTDEQKISILSLQTKTYEWLQQALIYQNKIGQALEISERGRARAFIDLLTSKSTNNNYAIGKLPTIATIQTIAQKQKATLVEYSVMGTSKLYIWIVKPKGEIAFEQIDLKTLKISLDKLVENSRLSIGVKGRATAQITPKERVDYKERLQQLHHLLIKPIAKHLPKNPDERVVFIPNQSLFLVPFPALVDENQKYLIEKHTILTAPAIQVLEFTEKNNPKPLKYTSLPQDEKLIVGNPIMPFVGVPPKQLSNLPGAENETRFIASRLNAKPLIGKEATKSAVIRKINNAKLVHLATHGLLDGFGERTPGAIALAPDSPPSPKEPNEGLLRTSEIVEKLKLKADLVVLSACDTGKGEISGDGVQGLSRALITAGAKSLIVSLWQVPDDATSDLMVEFYQQLEQNPDKARALRQAMLKTKEKHPGAANWAAFTIIGNPE